MIKSGPVTFHIDQLLSAFWKLGIVNLCPKFTHHFLVTENYGALVLKGLPESSKLDNHVAIKFFFDYAQSFWVKRSLTIIAFNCSGLDIPVFSEAWLQISLKLFNLENPCLRWMMIFSQIANNLFQGKIAWAFFDVISKGFVVDLFAFHDFFRQVSKSVLPHIDRKPLSICKVNAEALVNLSNQSLCRQLIRMQDLPSVLLDNDYSVIKVVDQISAAAEFSLLTWMCIRCRCFTLVSPILLFWWTRNFDLDWW